MSKNDFSRLFDQLDSLSVGFGPVFRDFQHTSSNYPPHNIRNISDTEVMLELAVAGFKKEEISLEEHQRVVTIRGDKETSSDTYQYRGIATRSFSKSFQLAEYYEVGGASLRDGILSVLFVKNIPDEAKPKAIEIN